MTLRDLAVQTFNDFEKQFGNGTDAQIGAFLVELANVRSERLQLRAALQAEFLKRNAAQIEAFIKEQMTPSPDALPTRE